MTWQEQFRDAVDKPVSLLHHLGLSAENLPFQADLAPAFPLRVPPAYLRAIRRGDPHDPLLRQVLPRAEESLESPGFSRDPTGDSMARKVPGLLHKYTGRVLVVTTPACAIHCRYCFRRHYPYRELPTGWRDTALKYIREDASVQEVILSGGDPLSLNDANLAQWFTALATIPHVRRVRLHTRVPVVLPERITGKLVGILNGTRLTCVVVIHTNHARELSPPVTVVLHELARAGLALLNQSVLLRGVNDDVSVLAGLSEALFAAEVLPYYLHLLDPVQGAAHFAVDADTARELVAELRVRLPGYLVPRLVREVAGSSAKTPL